jgi:site-specific recombinase XerD
MAEPQFDRSNGWWYIRVRTGKGTRVKKPLRKDPRWRRGGAWPPKGSRPKPPPDVLALARPFQDMDIRARLGQDVKVPRATPIADFLDAYMASYRVGRKHGSIIVLRRAIGHFTAFCRERRIATVEGLTRADCRAYVEWRRSSGAKYNTVRAERGVLGGAWSRALEDALIETNPWHRIRTPGEDDSTATPAWTQDEVDAITSRLKGWAREVFIVGIHCGFRITALLSLRWRDVRWTVPRRKFGLIVCRKESAKGKREYAVPLFGPAHDVLARHKAESPATGPEDLIWPGKRPGKPYSRVAFWSHVVRAIDAAGIERRGHECHALRATFATLMAARGITPRTLQAWMAHSSLQMTDRYVSHTAEADDAEAAKVESLLNQEAGPDPLDP